MKVCFSGTFNVLHKGHKQLIEKALEIAGPNGTVYIGIAKGKLLENKKFKKPLSERLNALKHYISSKGYDDRIVIKVISEKLGPATTGDYDAIIVSSETKDNAERINKKRIENNKKSLKIIEVPYVLAEDNKRISATRILNDEIDENGQIKR